MLAVFEDGLHENFSPLTLTRPVFSLKCGKTALYEKIIRSFPGQKSLFFMRDYLADTFTAETGLPANRPELLGGEDLLIVNGRWLFPDDSLPFEGDEEAGYSRKTGELLYARIKNATLEKIGALSFQKLLGHVEENFPRKTLSGRKLLRYPWEIIENNPQAIRDDFSLEQKRGIHCEIPSQSALTGDEGNVFIHESVKIHPCVVIDASGGPVTIEEGAVIYPNTWLQGPAFIGRETQVFGAKIREGVSAGPVCRLGGEIEETIIHGYSNKYHDGFLGHSYLGEFINLGAGTITSDLRVDFGKTDFYIRGKFRPTGRAKVGSCIGDHAKTGVTSVINTASSIGVLSVVLGVESVIPRFIPSCSWYIKRKITRGFGFQKLLEGAEAQMKRRGRHFSEADIRMLDTVYEITRPEREAVFKLYPKQ